MTNFMCGASLTMGPHSYGDEPWASCLQPRNPRSPGLTEVSVATPAPTTERRPWCWGPVSKGPCVLRGRWAGPRKYPRISPRRLLGSSSRTARVPQLPSWTPKQAKPFWKQQSKNPKGKMRRGKTKAGVLLIPHQKVVGSVLGALAITLRSEGFKQNHQNDFFFF